MSSPGDAWAVAAAIAGCVSAIASAIALVISATQTSASSKAIGFASAQAFSSQCRELWKDCRLASTDAEKFQECLDEILASFELFAIAVNDLNLSDKVRSFIVETITDYLSQMQEAGYSAYVSASCEKKHVCKELKLLVIQHRTRFPNPSGIAEMLGIERASLS